MCRPVFPTRGEFTYAMPPHTLFDEAKDIRAAGLSLNLVCQQYPDQRPRQHAVGGRGWEGHTRSQWQTTKARAAGNPSAQHGHFPHNVDGR
jgi:hypothetical protein